MKLIEMKTTRYPKGTLQALKRAAKKEKSSVDEMIRRAVAELLERMRK